jgi:flagellar hook-associated protein 3 FlgL
MSQQYNQVSILQSQVSTGKKLQKSSDDPTLASRIKSVEDYITRLDSYATNTSLANSRLSLLDKTLQEEVDLTIKAKELVLHAQNGTLNDKNREDIATQLSGVLASMLHLANSQDGNGEYLFNGFQASKLPFIQTSDGFKYQGSYEGNSIAISDYTQVQHSDSGFAVFGDIKTGNGSFSVAANTATNTGTGVLQPVTTLDANEVVDDDYTLTIVINSSGKLAYEIIGLSSGQVIPAPPLTAPADAPEYTPGGAITFNGITTQLNGEPAVGDEFTIKQSRPQNIFQTLQNIIDTLKTPHTSAKIQADMTQALLEQSSTLAGSLNHLVNQLASVGDRKKMVEDQIKLNKDRSLDQQVILGSLSEVDMAEAISGLTQQLTALNMSQQSYSKVQEIFSQLLRGQFR